MCIFCVTTDIFWRIIIEWLLIWGVQESHMVLNYELSDRCESPPPLICFNEKYECTMSSESLTHTCICYIPISGVHSICFVLWRMHRSKTLWTLSIWNYVKVSVTTNICYCQYLVFITTYTYLGQLAHLQVIQKSTEHFGG